MATSKSHPEYQNNPFYIATNGLNLLFKKAQAVGILFIIVSCLGLGGNFVPNYSASYEDNPSQPMSSDQVATNIQDNLASLPTEAWVIIGIIITLLFVVGVYIGVTLSGISAYTAAKLSEGKRVGLQEAFSAVMRRFFGYLWLQILAAIKVLLWSLLLIVPGIIMATRYSLAGTAFFAEQLGAQAAIKRSTHLTKGAWFTTFGAYGLFNLITFGLIEPLLHPGTSAVVFGQYKAYDRAHLKKPSAHFLSWLVFFVQIALVAVLCFFIFFISLFILATPRS